MTQPQQYSHPVCQENGRCRLKTVFVLYIIISKVMNAITLESHIESNI